MRVFTFARECGVEPTNNVAERRVRPAVIAETELRNRVVSGAPFS